MAIEKITKDNFDQTIQSGKTVLVDFFAEWCGPCKALSPLLEEISGSLTDDQAIVKLDIDENLDIARRFGVMSVPTLIVFKDGEIVQRVVGLRGKDELLALFA